MSGSVRAQRGKGRTRKDRERRKFGCLSCDRGASVTKLDDPTAVSYLFDVFFFQQKLRNVFLSSNFFLLEDVQCPALSVKSLFFLSSSSLQLLIFFIKRLDYSSLLSFTNQGPFVWKREDKNMQQKPLKAILMMCLCVICVIDYHIRVD